MARSDAQSMDRGRALGFERRMSDQESLMWNIEKDPWLNPSGALLTILDRPADFDLLLARIRYGITRLPRLRERVVPGLGRLAPPVWATDADFDLGYHVRRLRLPEPGSMRQLLDLVTRLYEEPYDRTRPLWLFYCIEGLPDGRGALFVKQHHSVADGIGALRMAEVYTDLERDVTPPPAVDLDQVIADALVGELGELLEAGADTSDSILDTATRTLTHNLRRQAGIAWRTAGGITDLATHPTRVAPLVAGAVEQVRSAVDTVGGGRKIDGGAPLWTKRSRRRHLEVLHLSLEDAKAAAKSLNGSVNDLFVTGAALGALAYHAERGVPIQALNMTFVVSTRSDKEAGGNSFTPVPVQIPVGDAELTTEERFDQVGALMAARRAGVKGRGAMSAVAGLVNLLPTSVSTRVARQQAAKVDLATSNIRGAPIQTYIAGAAVLSCIPLGPVAGTAANLTTISQNGWMDMGLLVDPVAVKDPAGLARNIDEGFTILLAAGGVVR
ncbi:MAG TPA: wax ester/triacylglycerol synthase domain-containing protein [Acidimicrobiales bacterium]|nr:wax ester/triacylglycerol synthase domain-containing protein [Acidimicrobiales bacterium]